MRMNVIIESCKAINGRLDVKMSNKSISTTLMQMIVIII